MSIPPARLSCQQCQRRKTRCDKQLPACTSCVKAGIPCTVVRRHRLPRGRTVKSDSHRRDLQARIERLEAAISTLDPEPRSLPDSQAGRGAPTGTALESLVAPEFWEELSETITGMREVLQMPAALEESDEENDASVPLAFNVDIHSHSALFPTTSWDIPHSKPDRGEESHLFEIYHTRVHTVFRVLHWPSILTSLGTTPQSGHERAEADDLQALRAAICFVATCSLHHHERDERLFGVDHHRQAVEAALVRANVFTTASIVTLQAFVLYLVGLRACQANAQQWTLTAVAIRLASAQGIPARADKRLAPFDDQLRRRLWSCIGLLDMQSAFDRGSRPLLQSDDLQSPPGNINDDDFHSRSEMLSPAEDRFTEMSFSLLVHRAGFCQRRLTELGLWAASGAIDPDTACHQQVRVLNDFEDHIKTTSESCDSPPTTIQVYTRAVGEESALTMRLLLHRPLHHRGRMSPFDTYMKAQAIDVLVTATRVLERSRYKRSEGQFAQWAWFSWVKWYALAIVLAELCTIDSAYADHAWEVARQSYDDYANAVADARSGLLWRPIANLMLKVKRIRSNIVTSSTVDQNLTYTNPAPSGPVTIDAVENDFLTSLPDVRSTGGMDVSASFSQVSLDHAGMAPIAENVPWSHWDMLIHDLNDDDLPAEALSAGLPGFDQLG